ncbi:phospholipase [Actinoplanes sp. TBRC 11911]|nr:phospholipase [Actinoplanes sp. TBRC 11911]
MAAPGAMAGSDARVAPPSKPAVLRALTDPGAESYRDWNEARLHPDRLSDYRFIWTTDYCTDGPDRPIGFDFRLACARHDFGYRNYKAIGGFAANRARIDRAFLADLRRKCATYGLLLRPVCSVLAGVYYRAARHYGAPKVSRAEVRRIESASKRAAEDRASR